MSTTAPSAPAVDLTSEPESRGQTTLTDRVIQKIAAQAALEVPHCVGLNRSVLGITAGRNVVNATAVTDGAITALTLSLAVAYPAPVTSTTRAVRSHVQHRIETLCGLSVDHIDITVAALPHLDRKEPRVR